MAQLYRAAQPERVSSARLQLRGLVSKGKDRYEDTEEYQAVVAELEAVTQLEEEMRATCQPRGCSSAMFFTSRRIPP